MTLHEIVLILGVAIAIATSIYNYLQTLDNGRRIAELRERQDNLDG
jgi:hypothetical protein